MDQCVIFDCQSTGASPKYGNILEMGWMPVNAEDGMTVSAPKSYLVKQSTPVPKRILGLTGITLDEMEHAQPLQALEKQLFQADLSREKCPTFISHYARFERAFVESEMNLGREANWICTFEIARRLYPDLPSRSIRAVSGYLGHPIDECKRSLHHVEATAYIWEKVYRELKAVGVTSMPEVLDWLADTPVPRKTKKIYGLPSAKRLELPNSAGIYLFKNSAGAVIYVGKATSLKSRVNSYFRGQKTKGSRLNELVTQIVDLETRTVSSPLEAAIVEADAIKEFSPPYNVVMRDTNRGVTFVSSKLEEADQYSSTARHVVSLGAFGGFTSLQMDPFEGEIPYHGGSLTWATLEKGRALFQSWYDVDLLNDDLTSVLAKLWLRHIERSRERLEKDEVEEDGDGSAEEELPEWDRVWTEEMMARQFYGSLTAIATSVYRIRWLKRLLNADLRWRKGPRGKWLSASVRSGEVVFNCEEKRSGSDMQPDADQLSNLFVFDRMNVLFTEILRLVKSSAQVEITFSNGRVLNSASIARYMFPGNFHVQDS